MKKIKGCILILLIICCFTGCGLTEEERAEFEAKHTYEYEVLSVRQYVSQKTNRFGGVIDEKLKYAFTFLGHDGQMRTVEDFQHLDYGLTKVCIGDKNKYVVKEQGIDEYRYLYLTKETLMNMTSK